MSVAIDLLLLHVAAGNQTVAVTPVGDVIGAEFHFRGNQEGGSCVHVRGNKVAEFKTDVREQNHVLVSGVGLEKGERKKPINYIF